jgi:hypothetical protein
VAEPPDRAATVSEALAAVGHVGKTLPLRPVLHGTGGTVLLLTTLDAEGAATPLGLWVAKDGIRRLGPAPPSSLLAEGLHLREPTANLVNLLQAAARSYIERLEAIAEQVDTVEDRWQTISLEELGQLHWTYRELRKSLGRFSVAVQELDGPLGEHFPGLEKALPRVQAELAHLEETSGGLGQSIRDLLALRNAAESNRLAEATNRLGEVSNQIAAVANTSNIRMLGIAYVALVIALVSVVVLIPNTAATILGMPSAAWVPGWLVDVVLVVLATLPLLVVFSRPWVRGMLRGLGMIEARTREGLRDLPEIPPADADRLVTVERTAEPPARGPS